MNFEENQEIATDAPASPREAASSSSSMDMSEFDPLRNRSDSKVEIGKGDLDLSSRGSVRSGSIASQGSVSSVSSKPSLQNSPRQSPAHRARSTTAESVSTMDLGTKEDYIYTAANQICLAQNYEANGQYDLAFACYKGGVGILLQGVQGMILIDIFSPLPEPGGDF